MVSFILCHFHLRKKELLEPTGKEGAWVGLRLALHM
jgi:hypothetical protein